MSKQPKEQKGTKMPKTSKAVKTEAEAEGEVEVPQVESTKPTLDDKGRKTTVNYSMEQMEQKGLKNKSQVIRYLLAEGYAPAAIARFLDIKYQFVRNVSMQPLKRSATTTTTAND